MKIFIMDKNFIIIILTIWAIQAFRQVLNWTYWLQTKEYRFDRFETLLDSKEGWKSLEIGWLLVKLAAIFTALFFGSYFVAVIVLSILTLKFFVETAKRTLRKPVFTLRAVEILGTCFLGILASIAAGYFTGIIATNLAVGEVLILICPVLGIVWTKPLVERNKKAEIAKAKRKLQEVKPLIVAVTGSYGKTTTKEFLYSLLSSRFKTAKTEKNQNTDFGVARRAAGLEKQTEVFVAEVGAYKRGEIKRVTNFLKPDVAVITGIEPQHLSLFGSLENIKKAKYELVEGLSQDGFAVFNFSNKYCQEMAAWARRDGKRVYGYALLDKGEKETADYNARIVKMTPQKITFTISSAKTTKTITAPLTGMHFVENLVGAILVAGKLGVSWDQIQERCKDIKPPGKTMSVIKTKSGATIIDDTYNSTPKAFDAALEYLSLFKNKRKIVVAAGILELGKESKKIHERLGEKMAKIADEVYVTNSDFVQNLQQTGRFAPDKPRYWFNQPDTVILFEGRMSAKVMRLIAEVKQ